LHAQEDGDLGGIVGEPGRRSVVGFDAQQAAWDPASTASSGGL
jgi:hypothetical protein